MMPKPQPISRFREVKRVTICAGFKSSLGVVICADSQETTGTMKFDAPKLVIRPSVGEPTDQVRMAFAGAGHGPFIDKLTDEMWKAAKRGPQMDHASVLNRVEDAVIECHRKIWGLYGADSRPETEMLFVIYTDTQVELYKSHGPIVLSVSDQAFVGVGEELAAYICEHVRSGTDSLEEDVSTGLYIIENAKKYVDGCGGDTQIAAVFVDGSIQRMLNHDARKMAETIFQMGRSIYFLFSLSTSLGGSKSDLQSVMKGVEKDIHDARAELRREAKGAIRLPKRLKAAQKVVYRKIEWPPLVKRLVPQMSEDQQ